MSAGDDDPGPALEPIELLHPPGDPEHVVTFARRTWRALGWPVDARGRAVRGNVARAVEQMPPGYQWEALFSIRARDLRGVFPQILEQLIQDSFFSVSGFYLPRRVIRPANPAAGTPKVLGSAQPSKTTVMLGGRRRRLPRATWGTDFARELTAAYADLDYYKRGLDGAHVMAELERLRGAGLIPPVSMFLFSGRGMWALWVLRDEVDSSCPVRATAANLRRWRHVQAVVHDRLAHLGSDAAARDVARMARVPGSLRTDLDDTEAVRVRFRIPKSPGGQAITYTLEQLEKALGIQAGLVPATPPPATGDVPDILRRRGRAGARGRAFRLLQQLDALEKLRGGWRVGTRGRALWLQVAATVSVRRRTQRLDDLDAQVPDVQRLARLTDDEILELAHSIANRAEKSDEFVPKAEAKAVARRAVREGGLGNKRTGGKLPAHQTVADWLRVTQEESARLREVGAGRPLPPAREFGPAPFVEVAPSRREIRAEARRAVIRSIRADTERSGLPMPPLRAIVEQLDISDLGASPETIRKDFAALGIENPRGLERGRQERERVQAAGRLPFEAADASTGIGSSDERSAG